MFISLTNNEVTKPLKAQKQNGVYLKTEK